MPRGSSTFGTSFNYPTIQTGSGVADGTTLTAFDATGLVGSFNQTVYPIMQALVVGKDFYNDVPFSVGDQLLACLARPAPRRWTKSSPRAAARASLAGSPTRRSGPRSDGESGPGGPLTWSDAEALYFGLAKQYRTTPANRVAFLSNDNMYRRFRQIPRARMTPSESGALTMLTTRCSACRIASTTTSPTARWRASVSGAIAFFRRQIETNVTTEGQTLTLANEMLITIRSRIAGAMTLGSGLALMTDGQITDG